MKEVKQMGTQALRAGQLWKLKHRYVRIMELSREYVRFKMMNSPEDAAERVLTSDIDCLWRYLVSRKGHVI